MKETYNTPPRMSPEETDYYQACIFEDMDALFDHAPTPEELKNDEGWFRWRIRKGIIEDET